MIKKLFVVPLLITLIVSSCTAQATSEPTIAPSTETQAPTSTQPPVADTPVIPTETQAQATAATEVTVTVTPAATRPPNDPNCTNSAAFVADITIPDNSDVPAGTTFTKTWRVSNTGTCIWASDYTLSHYSDEAMNAPASVALPLTYPGQTADLSVNLVAPNSLGKHQGNFVIKNPTGLIMKVNEDSRLWVIINATSNAAAGTVVTAAPTQAGGPTATPGTAELVLSTCAFTSETTNITETLNAINAHRTANNLPPYTVNSSLARAAQSHANDMACKNLTGHVGSNGSTPQSRATATGYNFSAVDSNIDENINISSPALTGQAVVNGWLSDTSDGGHQGRNLVSDTFIDIGIGYTFFNNTGYYVVIFGTQ